VPDLDDLVMEPRFVAGGRGSLVPLQRQSLRSGFGATRAAKRGLDLRPSMTVDDRRWDISRCIESWARLTAPRKVRRRVFAPLAAQT
jgi:hypothetical protein